MSSKFPKKLQPAKKAWKSIKATLQTRLAKISISTTIKRTKKYCTSALSFIRGLIPRRFYALTSSSASKYSGRYRYYQQQNQYKPGFSAIYIDELFPGQHGSFTHHSMKGKETVASTSGCENRDNYMQTTKHDQLIGLSGLKIDEKMAEKRNMTETGETSRSAAGGSARKLPLLPQFRGVDERAEEFISKFREDRKLEREKSIIDFQEMLARGS